MTDTPKHPDKIGPYRIESRLGGGGMGEVYRAVDERLGRTVAMKQINVPLTRKGRERERFWREARSAALLDHPAIVKVFDIVESDDGDWIVMEFVDGSTLTRLITGGPLDVATALPLFHDVTSGLAEAHDKGILHRDLKPDNVMITEAGHAKILDFGLARQVLAGRPEDRVTVDGRILGTPHAMSPEQAQGLELSHRSDLFSLGTLIYETLSGKNPFRDRGIARTLMRVCEIRQAPLWDVNPEIPDELSELVERLLAKDPARRPGDAHEVAAALERLAESVAPGTVVRSRERVRPRAAVAGQTGSRQISGAIQTGAEATGSRQTGSRQTGSLSRSASAGTAERRQITALYCELMSAGPATLYPEDLAEERPAFQRLAAEVAQRYEGHLEEVTDRGVLLCFGYPRTHEDMARRAVHAARELAARFAEANGGDIAVRAGIHTGLVEVRATGSWSVEGEMALGETAAVAAAVAGLAPAAGVVLSDATHGIVEHFFHTEVRAQVPVAAPGEARGAASGASQTLTAYLLLGDRDVREPLDGGVRLTPMVARQQELELLLSRWQLITEGMGHVVLISGEAGIGKSRLVRAFAERLTAAEVTELWCQCSAFETHTPFGPIVDLMRRLAPVESDAPGRQLDAIETFLRPYDDDPSEAASVLSTQLAIPVGSAEEPPEATRLSPRAQRRRTLETLLSVLQGMAEERPVLMVVEDLQWVDPSTLELLELLVEQGQGVPFLLLLSFRSGEFQPPWGPRSHITQLTLGRLNREQVGELIRKLSAGDTDGDDAAEALPADIEEAIAAKTDGVPLFIEEVTKAFLESSPEAEATGAHAGSHTVTGSQTGSPLAVAIPPSLRDFLMSRLDRLKSAKAVAQQAAALGRTFTQKLLAAVSPLAADELTAALERLIAAEVFYRRGIGPRARYTFRNALIQDAAYLSLLDSERRKLHRKIAVVLERSFPELVESQPQLLAHHHTEAGDVAAAVEAWQRAGRRAVECSANAEAIAHLRQGLEVLATAPAGPERDRHELPLQLGLGGSLVATRGYGAPEVAATFARAHELAGRVGEASQDFLVLYGLHKYDLGRAEMRSAREVAEQLLRRAGDDRDLLLEAHRAFGITLLHLGELDRARGHLERSLALHDGERHGAHPYRYGSDPAAVGRSFLALTLWLLGFPDQALEHSRQAVARARECDHALSLSLALQYSALVREMRRETGAVGEPLAEAVALSEEQELTFWAAIARVVRGWSQAEEGRGEQGIADMRAGLDACRDTGTALMRPYLLGLLAGAVGRSAAADETSGQILEIVDEALAAAGSSGESWWAAELHRLRGEALLESTAADAPAVAEACFQQALETARRQGAKSLELRASMSLARRWQTTGEADKARDLLAAVFGELTEGFGSGDLQAAAALLEELG